MFPRSSAQRRALSLSLCHLLVLQLCLQTITIQPVNGDLDFWTKLKLIGLLALTNKISIVPIPMPIPVPIHLEGKDEVVFLKAPPPISSAYSYMAPPMLEYGHSPYSTNRGSHYSSNGYGDAVGHASELVPMVAAASVRYGDRISPSGASHSHSPAPSPTSSAPAQRPVHRGRAHRNRNLGRPKGEYTPPTTTPVPAQPPSPSAALPIDDYAYRTPYEAELSKPQVETMKIAIIPVKASELGGTSTQSQAQVTKESSDSSVLPENLLNYIRQVQGLTLTEPENKATESGQSSKPTDSSTSEEAAVSDSADKWKVSENATASPIEVSTAALPPTTSSVLSQYQSYQSPFSIQNQQSFNPITVQAAPVLSPIQSQWQHNLHSSVGVTSTTQYRPPELKVIRTRYNPKAHLEQVRSQPPTPTIGPLSSLNSVSSYQDSPSVSAAAPPQQTQFIYSVSHQAYNPPGTSFYSAPSNYASSDNFGLSAFRQAQSKQAQGTKPSFVTSPLTAAASVESGTWVKPNEKAKTRFLNNVGHRLSHLF